MLLTALPRGLPAWHPAAWIGTWLFSGLLPAAPGTWGSLAALPFAWAISDASQGTAMGRWGLVAAAVALFPVGCWASAVYMRRARRHDPGAVVVDEVVAMWLTLAALTPETLAAEPYYYGLGFACFRVADIVKPWPVRWVDRQVGGGLGVMLDDVAAVLYAAPMLWLSATVLSNRFDI